jgi:hypothetical protein
MFMSIARSHSLPVSGQLPKQANTRKQKGTDKDSLCFQFRQRTMPVGG